MSPGNTDTRPKFTGESTSLTVEPGSDSEKHAVPSYEGDAHIKTTTTEAASAPSAGFYVHDPTKTQNYRTNSPNAHRSDASISTDIYDPDRHPVTHPSYTIPQSDFKHTTANSGSGIHARQYHTRRGRDQIPVGTTTYIRDIPGVDCDVYPPIWTRVAETERAQYSGRGRSGMNSRYHENDIEEEPRHQELEMDRDRERGVMHEQVLATEQENTGAHARGIRGLFGRSRRRDSPLVAGGSDTTNTRSKSTGNIDAERNRLSTLSSERERPARERNNEISEMPQSPSTTQDIKRDRLGTDASDPAPVTRIHSDTDAGTGTTLGSDQARQHTIPRSTAKVSDTARERSGRTDSGDIGSEHPDAESRPETKHATTRKPTMMDKIFGGAEAAIGKGTGNATMDARGEQRAAGGLSKN